MSEKRIRQYEVLINEDNMRLDEYLAYKIARFSRTQACRCIKLGGVSLNPFRPPKPSLKVHTGDMISIAQTMSGDVPMYEEVKILYENEDFWIFDKPAGMAVHPTANIYHNTLTRFIETELHQTGFVVHRLDKETSGILAMAKNAEVSKMLDEMFLSHQVYKQYEAIVYNADSAYYPHKMQEIDIPLGFAGRVLPRITMGIGNLPAHTTVECTDIHGEFARCKIEIQSGRQHQIRVHLALTGTPIIGDKLYLYGEEFYKAWLDREEVPAFTPDRQLLHAARLCFNWKGKSYQFDSPIPEVMNEVFRGQLLDSMFPTPYSRLFLK